MNLRRVPRMKKLKSWVAHAFSAVPNADNQANIMSENTTEHLKKLKRYDISGHSHAKLSIEPSNHRLETLYVLNKFNEHLRSLHRLSVKEADHRLDSFS